MANTDRFDWVFIAKCAWVGLCLCILIFGLGTLSADPDGKQTPPLLAFMMVLGFPASILPLIALSVILPTFTTPINFVIEWLAMFVAGYIQWFAVVPDLNNARLITLGLSVTPKAERKISRRSTSKSFRRHRKQRHCHSAFDERGMTPLERALDFQRRD